MQHVWQIYTIHSQGMTMDFSGYYMSKISFTCILPGEDDENVENWWVPFCAFFCGNIWKNKRKTVWIYYFLLISKNVAA